MPSPGSDLVYWLDGQPIMRAKVGTASPAGLAYWLDGIPQAWIEVVAGSVALPFMTTVEAQLRPWR